MTGNANGYARNPNAAPQPHAWGPQGGAPMTGNANGYGAPQPGAHAWGPQGGAPAAGPMGYKPMTGATPPVYAPPAGMAYGGRVPGYAMGGGVFGRAQQAMGGMTSSGMSPSIFGRAQQATNNMFQPRQQATPATQAPSGNMPNTAPGYYTSNGSWSMVDPTSKAQKKAGVWTDNSGNVRNADGNLVSFDPRNPYAVMSGSYDPTTRGVGMRQLGAFGEAGYWDPNGNQALMNSVRNEALYNARASQQGAGLRAQLAGMDPGAASSYALEAGLRGSSDVARASTTPARSRCWRSRTTPTASRTT